MKLLIKTNDGLKLSESATSTILSIENQIKELEKQESIIKEKIMAQMKSHNCKAIENDDLAITYVEPTRRFILDTQVFKKMMPDTFKLFSKTTFVNESVRIRCK